VLNHFFSEVVIDAEDRRLRKVLVEYAVELPRGCEVAAKRFFDDHARVRRAAGAGKLADHRAEHARRNGEVVRRTGAALQLRSKPGKGAGVVVVAIDVSQP